MPQYVNSSKTCRITETDIVNDLDVPRHLRTIYVDKKIIFLVVYLVVEYFKQFWKIQLHSLMEKGTYFNANHYFLFKPPVFLSNLQ